MGGVALGLAELQQVDATSVKNSWGTVARKARELGQVAITTRSHIDYVLLSAERYAELQAATQSSAQQKEDALVGIVKKFDERVKAMAMSHLTESDDFDPIFEKDFSEVVLPIVGTNY